MFADLNKHAVRPTKSLGILYDLRDPLSQLSLSLITAVPCFKGLTETGKTTISNRSIKLFTLSGIYQGTKALLNKAKNGQVSKQEQELVVEFWKEVGKYIPEWPMAQERKDFIHAHGIALHAIGIAGASLIGAEPKKWKERLKSLSKIDWLRSNTQVWEGRAMIGGRVSKAHSNVVLTAAFLKRTLGVPLSPEEQRLEASFNGRGSHGN